MTEHEQAAFQGANAARKPWPTPLEQRKMLDEPAYEEIMQVVVVDPYQSQVVKPVDDL